jgi:MoaA/NifB/PqqE/SkfB family radical SAM enzyme
LDLPVKKILRPQTIRLEASTVCQLRCHSCPTASGAVGQTLGQGFLKFSDFKKTVDDNPWVSAIELSNWGEIFLNKELVQIIRYAYERNVALKASNGVNLNSVSEETLEALVKYRFRSISCSIDGASPHTYSQYRRNGNFQKVIDNIKTINKFKREYCSRYPLLRWQYVIFGHNEQEVGQARAMADELDMKFSPKLSWDDLYSDFFSPIRDAELVRKQTGLGVATREEYWQKFRHLYVVENCCLELWHQPQINYDGRLLGCSINYWADYGNVFQDGLTACLNNEKINYVRDLLMGQHAAAEGTPCSRCRVYQKRKENNYWIKQRDIKEHYTTKRTYIMLENKILGTRCTNLARFVRKILKRIKQRGFKIFSGRRKVYSRAYSLHIPLASDKNRAWQPFHIFEGTTAGMRELSCHASVLIPGHCPHTPHRHQEEELLLLLSGEVDIILPDAADQTQKVSRRLKAGQFVYYPSYFAHTLVAAGDTEANYLMFKWYAAIQNKNSELAFGCFDMIPSEADQRIAEGFHTHRIFKGHTAYLSKLECHFSTLTPQSGYKPHIDDYNVIIVVLKGQMETLGQRVSPYDVIFYAAGKRHGMHNPGDTVAKYLVFEFHPLKSPFLKWIHHH